MDEGTPEWVVDNSAATSWFVVVSGDAGPVELPVSESRPFERLSLDRVRDIDREGEGSSESGSEIFGVVVCASRCVVVARFTGIKEVEVEGDGK